MNKRFFNSRILVSGMLTVLFSAAVMAQAESVTFQKENVDFSKYSKVHLMPLDLSDVKVVKPVWEQDDPEEWSFDGGSGEEIQNMFHEIISNELSKYEGFEVVESGGKGVLQVEVEFLSITPYAKPGSRVDDDKGYEISTLGSGDVFVSAEIRDSRTGELFVLVEGERTFGAEYKELTRENHVQNLKETFKKWGYRIRLWLDVNTKS
jgi:hypothetical protein